MSNREIKFRGVSVFSGEWVYGSLVQNKHRTAILNIFEYVQYGSTYSQEWLVRIDSKTVGQYVGIKDSDGAELFEGDIYMQWGERCTCDSIFEIGSQIGEGLIFEGDFEIIGNIHTGEPNA